MEQFNINMHQAIINMNQAREYMQYNGKNQIALFLFIIKNIDNWCRLILEGKIRRACPYSSM